MSSRSVHGKTQKSVFIQSTALQDLPEKLMCNGWLERMRCCCEDLGDLHFFYQLDHVWRQCLVIVGLVE